MMELERRIIMLRDLSVKLAEKNMQQAAADAADAAIFLLLNYDNEEQPNDQ